MSWLENHELAERECRTGWFYEDLVANILGDRGLDVKSPPKSWRKDVAQRRAYVNEVDLWVNGLRMSVKSRRVAFECPDTIPRNRNPLFVDTVRKWRMKDPEPAGVICVSQETQAIIWTPVADKAHWGVRQAYDQTREYEDAFMTADRTLWRPLDALVHQLHTVWDGTWSVRTGQVAVEGNCIVLEGTDRHLKHYVGRRFYELLGPGSRPERIA